MPPLRSAYGTVTDSPRGEVSRTTRSVRTRARRAVTTIRACDTDYSYEPLRVNSLITRRSSGQLRIGAMDNPALTTRHQDLLLTLHRSSPQNWEHSWRGSAIVGRAGPRSPRPLPQLPREEPVAMQAVDRVGVRGCDGCALRAAGGENDPSAAPPSRPGLLTLVFTVPFLGGNADAYNCFAVAVGIIAHRGTRLHALTATTAPKLAHRSRDCRAPGPLATRTPSGSEP